MVREPNPAGRSESGWLCWQIVGVTWIMMGTMTEHDLRAAIQQIHDDLDEHVPRKLSMLRGALIPAVVAAGLCAAACDLGSTEEYGVDYPRDSGTGGVGGSTSGGGEAGTAGGGADAGSGGTGGQGGAAES